MVPLFEKLGLFVDLTPTATGLQGMQEHRITLSLVVTNGYLLPSALPEL